MWFAEVAAGDVWLTLAAVEEPARLRGELGLVAGSAVMRQAPLQVSVHQGAMQFLSVPLLAAGIPLLQLATTTLVINFRHVFYGLSFPLRELGGKARRAYGVFALTDETYSLVVAKAGESLSGRRIQFIQLFSHAWWIIGSTCCTERWQGRWESSRKQWGLSRLWGP
ncbi:AzlC family ABC transporter permease [Streptomyces sp. NBC_01431]|uniref:AzlC family ABC transporter permease n=1 Tax=Streptomyces sp. NBC_01431 TaxID=2903863 RepID=UPI003FCEAAFD